MKTAFATCLLTCVLLVGLSFGAATSSAAVQLVAIISENSRLVDIDAIELRRIFLGYAQLDPDGRTLIPLNHPPGADARKRFDQVLLGFNSNDAAKYWVDQRIRGARVPPRTAAPEHLLQRVVAKLPGAISYVPQGSLVPGVRALTIDGKHAGEPGYPL
jgi:hypothetical protein